MCIYKVSLTQLSEEITNRAKPIIEDKKDITKFDERDQDLRCVVYSEHSDNNKAFYPARFFCRHNEGAKCFLSLVEKVKLDDGRYVPNLFLKITGDHASKECHEEYHKKRQEDKEKIESYKKKFA